MLVVAFSICTLWVPAGPSDAELAQVLLRGDTLADAETEHFDFVKRYHIVRNPRTKSREIFFRNLKASYDRRAGILTVCYTGADKVFATGVLRYTITTLEQRFSALTEGKAGALVQYPRERLPEVQKDLQNAQNKLVDFEVTHGIVDIQSQFQGATGQIASIESQIQGKELQLPDFVNGLKSGSTNYTTNGFPQDRIPAVSTTYANLELDVTMANSLYSALRRQYETAELESMASARNFEIVEASQIPETKSGPQRSVVSIIVVFITSILALGAAFVGELFDKAAADPVEGAKVAVLRGLMRRSSPEPSPPSSRPAGRSVSVAVFDPSPALAHQSGQ